jgi:glycosidase
MKIITDFVPNHCSWKHPFFIEAQKYKKSDYVNWFYFTKWPNDYLCFLSIKDLPKINLDYKPAQEHITDAAKYWLELGFDGFRLDHIIGPSHTFLNQFKQKIKKEYPNVVLIGEAWMKGIKFSELKTINVKWKILKWFFVSSSDLLFKDYIKKIDGVLDFKLQDMIKTYVLGNKSWLSKKAFYKKIKNHYDKYPNNFFLPIFLDNHDMNRFLFESNNDINKLKQAAKIQFSLNQPAIIYYGTEIGIKQNQSIWRFSSHGDLQVRQPMIWNKQDLELQLFYKQLIEQKRNNFGLKNKT